MVVIEHTGSYKENLIVNSLLYELRKLNEHV